MISSRGGFVKGGDRIPPLDSSLQVCYDLYQVRSEVTPNIMACNYGGQGGRCTRCGHRHPHTRAAAARQSADEPTQAREKAIKEQTRRKEAYTQKRLML